MCNTVCKRARVYDLLPCVTCNTVTCEARQNFGPYIVHGITASQYQFQGWFNCPVITNSLILC